MFARKVADFSLGFVVMTDVLQEEELAPIAHVTINFNGPTAPHWEMRKHFGEDKILDDFWTRVQARLLLLPKHDPQFRRNRERVNRDAERERIVLSWDLGEHDEETVVKEVVETPQPVAESAEEVSDEETESPEVVAETSEETSETTEVPQTEEASASEKLPEAEETAEPKAEVVEESEPVEDSEQTEDPEKE